MKTISILFRHKLVLICSLVIFLLVLSTSIGIGNSQVQLDCNDPNLPPEQLKACVLKSGQQGSGSGVLADRPGITTPAVASGTSYFVSPSGSGVSSNRSAPGGVKASIDAICGQIQPGDEIVFLAGTYMTSSMGLGFGPGGDDPYGNSGGLTFSNRNCGNGTFIIIRSDTPQAAVIRNDMGGASNSNIDIRSSSYISVQDFLIEGNNSLSNIYEYGIGFVYGTHHVQVAGNIIKNVGGSGISVSEKSNNFSVINNEVYDAASKHPYCTSNMNFVSLENIGSGDDQFGYSNYILNNVSVGARSRGSDIGNPSGDCDSNGTSPGGVKSDGNCLIMDYNTHRGFTSRTLIANNLCVDTGGGGFHFYDSGYADVVGNISYFAGRQDHTGGGRLPDLSISCYDAAATSINFISNIAYPGPGGRGAAETYTSSCANGNKFENNIFVGSDGTPTSGNFVSATPTFTSNLAEAISCSGANAININPADIFVNPPSGDGRDSDFTLRTDGAMAGYKICGFDVPTILNAKVKGDPNSTTTTNNSSRTVDTTGTLSGSLLPDYTSPTQLEVAAAQNSCIAVSGNCAIVETANQAIDVMALVVMPLTILMTAVGGVQYAMAGADVQNIARAKGTIYKAGTAVISFIFLWAFLQWLIPGGAF